MVKNKATYKAYLGAYKTPKVTRQKGGLLQALILLSFLALFAGVFWAAAQDHGGDIQTVAIAGI